MHQKVCFDLKYPTYKNMTLTIGIMCYYDKEKY